jgi:hypothetical protein
MEVHARGTDLFMSATTSGDSALSVLMKSVDKGQSWAEWKNTPSGRIAGAPAPMELTTVGTHVVRFGISGNPSLWVQSKDVPQDPVQDVIFTPSYANLGGLFWSSSLSVAQAGSSAEGDYVRVAYPGTRVVGGVTSQVVNTGLFRMDANEFPSALPASFETIAASSSTGSILYATLVEADRVTGPAAPDERPPVVLYWVETTSTPTTLQWDTGGGCWHTADASHLPR